MRTRSKKISQIFDKILKRILNLSKIAIISLINGIFNENFPLDSEISLCSTENIGISLSKTVADIIIVIRWGNKCRKFHIEGQINADSIIVLRVFEYGFRDALKNQIVDGDRIILPFPAPVIIFLEHNDKTPDEVILELNFDGQGKYEYRVPTMKFLSYGVEELHKLGMTILLPFYLLKLRGEVRNVKRRKRNKEAALREKAIALRKLINEDIVPTIYHSVKSGVISHNDVYELLLLLQQMYDYLYGNIPEFEEEEVNSMIQGALVTEYDIKFKKDMEREVKKALERERKILAKQIKQEFTQEVTQQVTQNVTQQVTQQVTQNVTKQVTQNVTKQFVQNLKKLNLSADDISTATGLSIEEIKKF